jgi:DNA-binding NarL/FixJ family response regulator
MANQESRPLIQIDDEVREMNDQEFSVYQEQVRQTQAREAETNARIAARQTALAKLAALGLTEAEIAAL